MSERGISVNELKLQLDDALSVRLASLVTEVAGSAMVQELGVSVDVGVVARIALLRGLSHLEQHGYGSTATTSAPAAVAAATPAAPAVAKSDTSDVARDGDGLIKPPEGWSAWVGTAVPESHSGVHAYYTGCGWSRWTGKAGTELMTFYWSPDESLQDVPVYDVPDVRGKTVLNQATPYGPGHIVPHGWSGGA